ncbi:MAG: NADH-quinone oxidoreductase subunit C, partial [Verrucomicrobiales bacterium]|nr:NADH-quinone oxidoreductase subunit C [Verrucomicrobiales bacterium]
MNDAVNSLKDEFGSAILEEIEFRGESTVVVLSAKTKEILQYCRDNLGFDYLVDISSLDNFGAEPRWEMLYELGQVQNSTNQHLRVKAAYAEGEKVETVSDLWRTADWHEREVYDMMGIEFSGHPDLRRILMWDGYPYFPLRKDFPLAGR